MPHEMFTGKSELRVSGAGGKNRVIEGYAAKFNEYSEVLYGMYREILMPGAFTAALARPDLDVRALDNHDPNRRLGRTKSGTLRLKQDDTGLWCSIDLPNSPLGDDVAESVGRGDCSQMSFQFIIAEGGERIIWEPNEDLPTIAIGPNGIERMYDICTATFPAYPDTEVSKKRAAALMDCLREVRTAGVEVTAEKRSELLKKFSTLLGEDEQVPPPAPEEPPPPVSNDELFWAEHRAKIRKARRTG